MVGLFFNGIFAADYIIGLDGVNNGIEGGAITGTPSTIYKQIAYIVAVTVYSFTVSAILAFVIDKIPGLKLRASEEAELLGMDDDQLGEFAYD
jgi:Amt family ammonium transporter